MIKHIRFESYCYSGHHHQEYPRDLSDETVSALLSKLLPRANRLSYHHFVQSRSQYCSKNGAENSVSDLSSQTEKSDASGDELCVDAFSVER